MGSSTSGMLSARERMPTLTSRSSWWKHSLSMLLMRCYLLSSLWWLEPWVILWWCHTTLWVARHLWSRSMLTTSTIQDLSLVSISRVDLYLHAGVRYRRKDSRTSRRLRLHLLLHVRLPLFRAHALKHLLKLLGVLRVQSDMLRAVLRDCSLANGR